MMERLTYWCPDGKGGGEWSANVRGTEVKGEEIDRLAYYEDMEEQGRLVVLPCRVGDTVYRIFAPDGREPVISAHTLTSVDYIVRWLDKFGKTVFLTREEAEQALEGGAE